MNDAVLAVMAGALRTYFIAHDELPAEPLAVSVPVGADDPGVIRRMGIGGGAAEVQLNLIAKALGLPQSQI